MAIAAVCSAAVQPFDGRVDQVEEIIGIQADPQDQDQDRQQDEHFAQVDILQAAVFFAASPDRGRPSRT